MTNYHQPNWSGGRQATGQVAGWLDEGLRKHMLRVFNYMAIGLVLTGGAAVLTASSESMIALIFGTPLRWVVMLAPIAFVLVLSFGINRLSAGTAQLLFWIYSAVMGLSLASIFLVYTGESVARVFFISAATFAATSAWGYSTKRDLSGMGSFMMMGLFGIMIASLVNIFLGSSVVNFVVSVIGVIVFTGLTAYDTQRIKEMYVENDGWQDQQKLAVMGALTLYLDFINMFMMMLQLMGQRRDS